MAAAVASDGSPYRVYGPGSSLKALLHRNGWCLHPSGQLTGPGNVRLALRTSSSKDVAEALRFAWSYHVKAAISHRNGLARADVPDVFTTARLLRRYSVSDQKVLALRITGAFQTAASKALWSSGVTSACPWCGAPETKEQRFLRGPAFAVIRDQHQEAVRAMELSSPHWVYAPFAVVPDEVDVLNLVFASRPAPAMPHAEAARLRQEQPVMLRFFTDGTCANPAIPFARHAAWSVVLDSAMDPTHRSAALEFWRRTSSIPPAFHVRACGLVPGRQTIARAEAWAALQAVRMAYLAGSVPVQIVTDSTYVVRILMRRQAGLPFSHVDFPSNSDIVLLFREVWFPGVQVLKVKSHQRLESIDDDDALWMAMGNASADKACARALEGDMSVVRERDGTISCLCSTSAAGRLAVRFFLPLTFAQGDRAASYTHSGA